MVKKKTWKEFRNTGLLWWINTQLHMFGWVLAYDYDNRGFIKRVYPARCDYRGVAKEDNNNGYQNVSKYLKDNAEQLYKETLE